MTTIAGIDIGAGSPCRFVAELSNNHNGSFARAVRLIVAAKEAGADFIKLQCFTPDELVALRGDKTAPEPWGSQGFTMRTLYEKAQTPFAWFPRLAEFCDAIGIPWFSSVFGPDSLALLESLDCPAYKVASLDRSTGMLATVDGAKTAKPTILSSPSGDDVGRASLTLYCPPGYPQSPPFNFQFDSVSGLVSQPVGDLTLSTVVNGFDGFSFHGTDPLPCTVAATVGAKLIEFHLQLRDEPSELESNVSLDEYKFAQLVRDVRRIEGLA